MTKKQTRAKKPVDALFAEELLFDQATVDAEGDDDLVEDDLVEVRPERLREAVVSATDWTTETIIRLFDRGTIELDPAFQRRDAWTPARKSRFIESLMMGLPIPQIVLAERKDKRGQFIVLDGKQRLLTLQQFAGDLSQVGARRLVLVGLKSLHDLNGKTFEDIVADPRLADDLEAFRNQPIRAVVVKNWPDENFLYLVFLRLNTGSVPLAPQELRQALHPGPFVAFANHCSAESPGLQKALRINGPDFRMRDVELLVRFLAFRLYMQDYAGNMKVFLDDACMKLNSEWTVRKDEVESLTQELEAAISVAEQVFPSGKLFSLYRDGKYEGRFNRAVFDVFTYYLCDGRTRKALASKTDGLAAAFERLCERDTAFRDSLQITTKSLGAVQQRFASFGFEISKLTKRKLAVPTLVAGRLSIE